MLSSGADRGWNCEIDLASRNLSGRRRRYGLEASIHDRARLLDLRGDAGTRRVASACTSDLCISWLGHLTPGHSSLRYKSSRSCLGERNLASYVQRHKWSTQNLKSRCMHTVLTAAGTARLNPTAYAEKTIDRHYAIGMTGDVTLDHTTSGDTIWSAR